MIQVNARLPFAPLAPAWHDWSAVCDRAAATAVRLLAGKEK